MTRVPVSVQEQARRERRAELWTRIFVVAVLVWMVGSSGLLVSLALNNRETLQRVKGCTTPGQACYERGRRQTGAAVTSINEVSVLAAACAADLPPGLTQQKRTALVIECVQEQLPR